MTEKLKELLERAQNWPKADQEELAYVAKEIEGRQSDGMYHATLEELKAIDEALAAMDRGEFATDAEVEAAFASFRNK
jgi:predicted transcriptional regulator